MGKTIVEIPFCERRYFNEYEVSQLYGLGLKFLRNARQGIGPTPGPPFVRVSSRQVRYDRIQLELWLSRRPRGGEQIEAPAPKKISNGRRKMTTAA